MRESVPPSCWGAVTRGCQHTVSVRRGGGHGTAEAEAEDTGYRGPYLLSEDQEAEVSVKVHDYQPLTLLMTTLMTAV